MKRFVAITAAAVLAIAALLSLPLPARADDLDAAERAQAWNDGTMPPDGIPQESWELTKKWLAAATRKKGATLAKLSPEGLDVVIHARDAKLSRACRRLDGKTLRGKAALTRLAGCLRPQLRRDDLRAESPAETEDIDPPDVLWDEFDDNDCDFGDEFAFDVELVDGRWTIAGVRIYLTDCVSP